MLRTMLVGIASLALLATPAAAQQSRPRPAGALIPMKVYKTPTCGCCGKWVEHVKAAGFAPEVQDLPTLTAVKQSTGVPASLQSCHTAVVDGYVIEGHVPSDVIQQLLKEKPKVAGIAVPGMPIGSPGMEQGSRKDPYDVVAFTAGGATSVYAKR
jgi:hypothetical protein